MGGWAVTLQTGAGAHTDFNDLKRTWLQAVVVVGVRLGTGNNLANRQSSAAWRVL